MEVNRRSLAEDLLVLCSDQDRGRPRIPGTHLGLGLGGALLLDLVLHGRVALADGHVVAVDHTLLGDPLLDAALREVASEPRSREPGHWVRHLSRGARSAVEQRLAAAGVLQVDDHRVLGIFHVHRCHQTDTRHRHELVERLQDAVVLGRTPSAEVAALVSLALAVRLGQHLFPRADRRAIQHRMQEIADGEWVGAAVRHNVDAVDAALGIPPVGTGDGW